MPRYIALPGYTAGMILVCLFCATHAFCQVETAKIDQYVKTVYERGQFNGSVLVAENGTIVYNKSFGPADFKTMENIQSDSPFRLASVAKAFTTMSIMMLKEAGKLAYENDVRKFIPELPYEGITIRHLMTHTSGIPDYMSLLEEKWDVANKDNGNRKIATGYDALALIVEHQPAIDFEPGEKWEYSNAGYVMLAIVVERVSGIKFDQFLQQKIFKPLGMSRTLLYSPIEDPFIDRRVFGYQVTLDGSEVIANDEHYMNGMFGDGEVYSTPKDMLKWDQALYTGKLVSPATLEEAFTPVSLNNDSTHNYGFGWGIGEEDGKKTIGHGGGWLGFRTTLHREVEDRRTLIILTNNSCEVFGDIRRALIDIIHEREVIPPKPLIARVIGRTIAKSGIKAGIERYRALKTDSSDFYEFKEWELRRLGDFYLEKNQADTALDLYQLNAADYPESAATQASLGNAYSKINKINLAKQSYEKSLELDPDNSHVAEKLKRLGNKAE